MRKRPTVTHVPNKTAREMIESVSKRTDLSYEIVYEMFSKGWVFTENIKGECSWHTEDPHQLKNFTISPITNFRSN